MQRTKKFLRMILIFFLSGFAVFVGFGLLVALTSFPFWMLEQLLILNGHHAKGMRIERQKLSSWNVHVEELRLKDENKDLEIQGLQILIPVDQLPNIQLSGIEIRAKKLRFRDETKPSASFEKFLKSLEQLNQQSAGEQCLRSFDFDHLSFAVSHSADDFVFEKVKGDGLCYQAGRLKFIHLSFQSPQWELQEKALELTTDGNYFHDLDGGKKLLLPRENNAINLFRPQAVNISH